MTQPKAKSWSPGHLLSLAAVAAVLALMASFFLPGPPRPVEGKSAYRVILPGGSVTTWKGPGPEPETLWMPYDHVIPTLDGKTFKLSDYRGKVLVVDFWAAWCGPCMLTMPHLSRIDREKRALGVQVIGLHINDRVSPDAIGRVLQQFRIEYPIGIASQELFFDYLGKDDVAIPQVLVFDRDGVVIAHFIAYSQDHDRRLDEAIMRALGQ